MAQVSVNDMVRAIDDADKPLTASGIADATGVTQQAISARRDELEADERVEYGQVGNARAYWLADPPEGVVEGFGEEMREMLDEQEQSAGGSVRDSGGSGKQTRGRPPSPNRPDEQQLSTLIEQLASRRAWLVFIGMVGLSVILTIGATALTGSILAAVLAHLAQITGTVGLGLGILGAFAAWTLEASGNGAETASVAGDSA